MLLQIHKENKNKGFTLIELIVVMVIMGMMAELGFSAFTNYSKQQRLDQAITEVRNNLERTKFNALSRVTKPAGCVKLLNYNLHVDGTNTYTIRAECDDSGTITNFIVGTYILPGGTDIFFSGQTNNCVVRYYIISNEAVLKNSGLDNCRHNGNNLPGISTNLTLRQYISDRCKLRTTEFGCIAITNGTTSSKVIIIQDKSGEIEIK